MNTVKNTDGSVETLIPLNETWKSGEIRQAADGRLGVVAAGPDSVGDGSSVKKVLHCGRDIECELTASVALTAGAAGAAVDIATQQLIAANGSTDVAYVLYDVAANGKARFILN